MRLSFKTKVPGKVYVNDALANLLKDELDANRTPDAMGGFLPAVL